MNFAQIDFFFLKFCQIFLHILVLGLAQARNGEAKLVYAYAADAASRRQTHGAIFLVKKRATLVYSGRRREPLENRCLEAGMRKLCRAIACVSGAFLAFYPVSAMGGEPVDGVWRFDVAATVALMRESGDLPAPLPEIEARLGRTRVTIDSMRKVFLVTEDGKERERNTLFMVSEREGVITLHRKHKADARYRFLEDGCLMGLEDDKPAFVLRRAE